MVKKQGEKSQVIKQAEGNKKIKKVSEKRKEKKIQTKKKILKIDDVHHNENKNDPSKEEEESQTFEDMMTKYESAKKETIEKIIPLVDTSQIKTAISVISQIIKKKYANTKNVLADESEEFVFLNCVIGKMPLRFSIRPVRVQLSNSIYGAKFNTKVCILVKDPRSAFKDLHLEFPFEVKVIDVEKLKLKYGRFEQRRQLLKGYEIFLCDFKIYMILKKLLGKPFYTAKKFPIPIKIDYNNPEEIKSEIISHVENSSHFYMSHGPNYTVKIAREVMDKGEILQNVLDAVQNWIPHVLKWGIPVTSIQALSIKGTNTVDLPIFNQLTEEEIKIYLNNEKK